MLVLLPVTRPERAMYSHAVLAKFVCVELQRYPEYYTVIQKPIDLRTVAQRVCNDEYKDLEAITADFDLLFGNACQFNEPGSCIFKDACRLRKFVHLRKQDLVDIISSGKGKLRLVDKVYDFYIGIHIALHPGYFRTYY